MMTPVRAGAVLVAVLLLVPSRSVAQSSPVVDTVLNYEFRSAFWLNLHNFLYVTARAERGMDVGRTTVTSARRDTVGFGRLPREDRDGWRRAVDYYKAQLAERDATFDTLLISATFALGQTNNDAAIGRLSGDATWPGVLAQAAPVYRRLWWTRHDRANKEWIRELTPLLARHGPALKGKVADAFRQSWSPHPIPVNVAAYTNWAGAYANVDPSHIQISSQSAGYRGSLALEMLLHESMHTLSDTIDNARRRAAAASGRRIPFDLTHALIFYSAGALVKRQVPDHIPAIERDGRRLRVRSSMTAYFVLIEQHWQPYLDGRISFDSAFARIVAQR